MLLDGEKITVLAANGTTVPAAATFSTSNTTILLALLLEPRCAIAVAGFAIAAIVTGGPLLPYNLGICSPADEGTLWARGWDEETGKALMAARRLWESGSSAV